MSIPSSVSNGDSSKNVQPPAAFSKALKKLHDRCEFLYSRVESATLKVIKVMPENAQAELHAQWDDRLNHLKETELQIFTGVKNGDGLLSLQRKCKHYEKELAAIANEIPDEVRPDLSPGKNNPRTLAVLAQETFDAGRKLKGKILQKAYQEEIKKALGQPFANIQQPTLTEISKSLTLKDLQNFKQVSKADQVLARHMFSEMITGHFVKNATPIKEVIGSYKWEDARRFLHELPPEERIKIKSLNLRDLQDVKLGDIIGLLELCPNVTHLEMGETGPMSSEFLTHLLNNPQFTRLGIPSASFDTIPEEHLNRMTAFTLSAQNDEDLQLQMSKLSEKCPHIESLSIKGPSYFSDLPQLTQIPSLPSRLKNLSLFGCDLKDFPELPSTMHSLRLSDVQIDHFPDPLPDLRILQLNMLWQLPLLPPLPKHLEILEIKSCPIQALPELPNTLQELLILGTGIKHLPEKLPAQLVTLRLEECKIANLPALPPSLSYLAFRKCPISECPALPKMLKFFDGTKSRLWRIPSLPNGLEHLRLRGCPIASPWLETFPSHLKTISYPDVWGDFEEIKEYFPADCERRF